MKLSEAKQIRAEIIRLCPKSTHKARNISKRVMQSLMNEQEDIVFLALAGEYKHMAKDYEIEDRYATQLERAFNLAKGEN